MLDKFRETAITWDKANRKVYEPLRVSAGDNKGRKLSVQVVNGGVIESLSGASLSLFWETKDKAHKGLDAFTAVDATKGEFEIYYTTGMLSNEGTLNANLVLVDASGRVVSEPFTISVFKGIDDDAIQSSDSFTALTEALAQVGTINNKADRSELLALESTFEQNKVSVEQQLQQTDGRIDTILELPDGSTTNDARLEDIKIGADGTVYDSPGNAVREQISKIQSQATVRGMLEVDTIPGTTQELTFTDGNVTLIQHKNGDGTVVRADSFTYATNLIIEQRTLMTGERIVFHYRLTDFSTQVLSRFQKLYRNELEYTPATWAEWQGKGTANIINGYLNVENQVGTLSLSTPTTVKPSTKYGILFRVRENTRTTNAIIVSGSGGAYPFPTTVVVNAGATGSFKSVQTTNAYTTNADFRPSIVKDVGRLQFGDVRVIELPAGSKVEQDFATLSADLLNVMYPWEVL